MASGDETTGGGDVASGDETTGGGDMASGDETTGGGDDGELSRWCLLGPFRLPATAGTSLLHTRTCDVSES